MYIGYVSTKLRASKYQGTHYTQDEGNKQEWEFTGRLRPATNSISREKCEFFS